MKKLKNLLFVLCMVLSISIVTGCSKTNKQSDTYKNYVQGTLDTNFKGIYDDYTKLTGSSEEAAIAIYESNISAITDDFLTSGLIIDPTEEDKERLRQFAVLLLEKADYRITEVEKKSDSYYVNVEIRPYVFYPTLQDKLLVKYSELSEKYIDVDIDSMSNEDYSAYIKEYNDATFAIMEEVLNMNQYEDPVIIPCAIHVTDYYYKIDTNDYKNIYSTVYVPIE